jgi:hypothetical protein
MHNLHISNHVVYQGQAPLPRVAAGRNLFPRYIQGIFHE